VKRTISLCLAVAILALAAACSNSGTAQNTARVRVLHASPDTEAVDILVDNDVKLASIARNQTSSFSEFPSGTHDFTVRSSANQAVLATASLNFSDGVDTTIVLYGKRSALQRQVLLDDTASPDSGKFKIRIADLAAEPGTLDLYVGGADISSSPPTSGNVVYATITDYLQVAEGGSLYLTLAVAGTKDVVFQSPARALSSGNKMTLAILPSGGGKLVNASLVMQGSDTTATFLANTRVRVKAVNAIPDAPGLSFMANGTILLSAVPFAGGSSYVTTTAGSRTLQLEAVNVPGTNIATLSRALDPALDYSLVATGTLSQPGLTALTDDNTLPSAGYARLRFVNAAADRPAVDALVNFASQASSIAYKSGSDYFQFLPADDYQITFSTPGGVTVVATLTPAQLLSGAVYTAYLLGPVSSPQVRLVRER
jgi:hypothetical protein